MWISIAKDTWRKTSRSHSLNFYFRFRFSRTLFFSQLLSHNKRKNIERSWEIIKQVKKILNFVRLINMAIKTTTEAILQRY
jgi:hypothetical protein